MNAAKNARVTLFKTVTLEPKIAKAPAAAYTSGTPLNACPQKKAGSSPFNTWRAIKPSTASSESNAIFPDSRNGSRAQTARSARRNGILERRSEFVRRDSGRAEFADADACRRIG